jgi:hypothetical protein
VPLPQKVIEQLGRAPARTPGWSGRLLMFSSTVFFIALALYVGVQFGYIPYVEGGVNELRSEMNSFNQSASENDQDKILSFHSQLTNIKTLLERHVAPSQLIAWLEKHTNENVAYGRLVLRSELSEVAISATARSAEDAVEQVKHLEEQPEVERVTFRNLAVAEKGLWQFDMTIFVVPDFLLQVAVPTALPPSVVPPLEGEAEEPVSGAASDSPQ